jgi:hypothetical protein
MGKYNIYPGTFVCHTCKVEVKSLRLYAADKLMTWMCPEKHLSQVDLSTKKTRKDYE